MWTVGLAAISRGNKPHLTVVGDGAWQVALLEVGADRILICSGLFEESANPAVRRLLTTLRQRVDVIVATGTALQHLERKGALARSVVVQLDAPLNQTDTPSFRALRQHMSITVAEGQLNLERIPHNEWTGDEFYAGRMVDTARPVRPEVVVTPDLQTAAQIAPPDTSLILAPAGDATTVFRTLPGVAIATNAYGWNDLSEQYAIDLTYLIRIFPDDPARFGFDQGRLVLPNWAQELVPVDQKS